MNDFLSSIPDYVWTCFIILIVGVVLIRLALWFLNRKLRREDADPAELTGIRFLKNTVRFLMWTGMVVSIVYTVPQWRSVAVTMFAGAGLLVAIIGFAAQAALGNIISGIFIVLFKPFRVGDVIKAGADHRGRVIDITLRHTVLQDFQNKRIIMPNSIISSTTVVNDTIVDPFICAWVEIDIAYDSDVEKATRIIQEEAMKHPLCLDQRTEEDKASDKPVVAVRIIALGEYFVRMRAMVWTTGAIEAWEVKTDLHKSLLLRFREENIEIPFPYRTLVYKKDL